MIVPALIFLSLLHLSDCTPVANVSVSVHTVSDCYQECGFFDSSDKSAKPFQFVAHFHAGFGNCISNVSECNAAIISPRHLLTSAQCVHYPVSKLLQCGVWPVNASEAQMNRLNQAYLQFQPREMRVAFGQNLDEVMVSRIFTYTQNWASPSNGPTDFAIIELANSIFFDESVRKICVVGGIKDSNELSNMVSDRSTNLIGYKQQLSFATVPTTVDFFCDEDETSSDSVCVSPSGNLLPGALATFDNNGRYFVFGQLAYGQQDSLMTTHNLCSWISETTGNEAECQAIAEPSAQCQKILEANKKNAEAGSSVKAETFLDKIWSRIAFFAQK